MSSRAFNAYATAQRETAVASARPIDLVVLVYQRLIDHLRHSRQLMQEDGDATVPLGKALDLLNSGLEACLDHEDGGEIATNLAIIYQWANREILLARLKNDAPKLTNVIDVLTTVYFAWQQNAAVSSATAAQAAMAYDALNTTVREQGMGFSTTLR
jgi:flagellar protein FliS